MDRDLCANCDRWREQHYNASGIFIADLLAPPCVEYLGTSPSAERQKEKPGDLERHRRDITQASRP